VFEGRREEEENKVRRDGVIERKCEIEMVLIG